jgi:hypothetical protein
MSIELVPYKGVQYAIVIDGIIRVTGRLSRILPMFNHIKEKSE